MSLHGEIINLVYNERSKFKCILGDIFDNMTGKLETMRHVSYSYTMLDSRMKDIESTLQG